MPKKGGTQAMQIQRQGSFRDEGYRVAKNLKQMSEPSALEAMVKYYTSDLRRFQSESKPIPAVLKANLHAVKERIRELGLNPQELLHRHNPMIQSSSDFHAMTKEVLAGLEQTNRERARLERTYKLDVQG